MLSDRNQYISNEWMEKIVSNTEKISRILYMLESVDL